MLFYHIWTLPILTNIYVAKTKQRMADTHLSIETTYIAYPICYTMMLPNMPFRKADAHPLRLNTRCKDLTLVPSKITWDHVVAFGWILLDCVEAKYRGYRGKVQTLSVPFDSHFINPFDPLVQDGSSYHGAAGTILHPLGKELDTVPEKGQHKRKWDVYFLYNSTLFLSRQFIVFGLWHLIWLCPKSSLSQETWCI